MAYRIEQSSQGCEHYNRRCAYISPCCGMKYMCRICHDDAEEHEIDRFLVTHIVCLTCNHQQLVNRKCKECGTHFGNYFCRVCRLFDNNDKMQFHCSKCGICRIGGRQNFFHCDVCGFCLNNNLKNSHTCIPNVSKNNCVICLEYLHTSIEELAIFPCGHILHEKCRNDLLKTGNHSCPLCGRSIDDIKLH